MQATGDPTRYLLDTYVEWAKGQGVPVIEGECVDLLAIETRPWARLGPDARAAFVNLAGRGDFISLIVIDVAPGGRIAARHAFDEMFFVLEGVVVADGSFATRALITPAKGAAYDLQNPLPNRQIGRAHV